MHHNQEQDIHSMEMQGQTKVTLLQLIQFGMII